MPYRIFDKQRSLTDGRTQTKATLWRSPALSGSAAVILVTAVFLETCPADRAFLQAGFAVEVLAGGPGSSKSAPSQPGNGNWAAVGYVGSGAVIWFGNVNDVCDLSGGSKYSPLTQHSIDAAATFQLSHG